LTSGWNSSFQNPHTGSSQPWGDLATPKTTYAQSYANSASGLQAFTTFGQGQSYPGLLQRPVTSTHSGNFTVPLGWDAQSGPAHHFNYGTSTMLSRSPSALYDESNTRLNQNMNAYGQVLASQTYQSVQSTRPPIVDHPSSLRSDSYPPGHQEIEHPLSAKAGEARNFVPAAASRQRSFSSDDWQKVSPPSASASNGKIFPFGDTFDLERDFTVKHIKQEVIFPGRRKYSSRS
jgi:hypothetical protein